MGSMHTWIGVGVSAALLGCGPEGADLDDVYPRNCGVEGPVELLDVEPQTYVEVSRAGEHYLVSYSPDGESLEHWAVDRCGEQRVRLHSTSEDPALVFGTAGDLLLSCDEERGAIHVVDPAGVEPPHVLFEGVAGCRVAAVGQGLAAQQRDSGTVWFHPEPSDPRQGAVVVTDTARVADPAWQFCGALELACDPIDPVPVDIRAAGDELLVVLENEELLAFSTRSLSSRVLDPGPVQTLDVLPEGRRVVVARHRGPTLVHDRETGHSFEMCCHDHLEPIRQLGDWLVNGSLGSPVLPEPPEWTTFRAHHLPTGARVELRGNEAWRPLASLTQDTILVDISPPGQREEGGRFAVRPDSGERQRVELPGEEAWTLPGHDGVYVAEVTDDVQVLRQLAGPDDAPRTLAEDAAVVFPTRSGRIVLARTRSWDEPTPLWVMRPDQSMVELEERVVKAFGEPHRKGRWPLDRDEVVYVVEDAGRWVLQRTVLP